MSADDQHLKAVFLPQASRFLPRDLWPRGRAYRQFQNAQNILDGADAKGPRGDKDGEHVLLEA